MPAKRVRKRRPRKRKGGSVIGSVLKYGAKRGATAVRLGSAAIRAAVLKHVLPNVKKHVTVAIKKIKGGQLKPKRRRRRVRRRGGSGRL